MTDSLSAIHHLIDDLAKTPAFHVEHSYRNPNGDLWQLVQEPSTDRVLVRHTVSGGTASEMTVEEFLAVNAAGPDRQALCVLTGLSALA